MIRDANETNSVNELEPERRFITCPTNQRTVPCGSAYSVKMQAQVHGSYMYVSAARTAQNQIVFSKTNTPNLQYSRPHAHDPLPYSIWNNPGMYVAQSVCYETSAFSVYVHVVRCYCSEGGPHRYCVLCCALHRQSVAPSTHDEQRDWLPQNEFHAPANPVATGLM